MTGPARSVPALTAAQRAIATFGLPTPRRASTSGTAVPAEIGETELGQLIAWASRERLDGLLWSALTAADARHELVGSDRMRGHAADMHLIGLRSSLAAEAAAVAAVATLRDAGIEVTLFKGLANAHLDYPRPEQRTFFDADLLVARHEFGRAIETLVSAGFTRSTPPIRKRWELRFARAAELRSPEGIEIDLHASLTTGYFGERLDHDALRTSTDTVRLAGRDHRTFGPAVRLLISTYGVVLSRGPSARLLRDVAQQLLATDADWHEAAHLAGDGDIVLARGLLEAARQLGFEHDAVDWARTIRPTPTAARALEYSDDALHQGWSADARSTMLGLGRAERIRFVAGVVLPSRASLRARGRTITGHLTMRRRHHHASGDGSEDQVAVHDR